MRCIALILVLLGFTTLAAAQLNATCLQNTGAVLVTPQNATYNNDRLVYNEKVQNEPAAIAYAYTEEQVQEAVLCAHASSLKAVPRGGGHGYEGYAVQNGALTVDVSNLTSFAVNTGAGPLHNTVTFGAGLRLGQLYLKMYLEANSLFPAGVCPWVGTAGHILGGGTGQNVRTYGLACDQVVSLNMVNYNGSVITATPTLNANLFWASCGGGGGNLGIVTSFTVKTNSLDALPQVTTMQFSSSYDHAVELFDAVQKWAPTADKRVNVQMLIGFGAAYVDVQFNGPQTDAEAAVQASGLLNVPGITTIEVDETSWINATLMWANKAQSIGDDNVFDLNMTDGLPASQGRSFQAASSYNQKLMGIEGIQAMVNAVTSASPDLMVFVEHKMLGGAVSAKNSGARAFSFSSSLYESQYFAMWTEGDLKEAANEWLISTKAAMKPYVGFGAYVNYPDPLLAATSWDRTYYGGNLEKYAQVKYQYDPQDYFSNPLTVMPANPHSPVLPSRTPQAPTPQLSSLPLLAEGIVSQGNPVPTSAPTIFSRNIEQLQFFHPTG